MAHNPDKKNDRHNITFTALYSDNNRTANRAEANSIRHSCFSENNTTQALIVGYMMFKLMIPHGRFIKTHSCIQMLKLAFHCDVFPVPFSPKNISYCWHISTKIKLSCLPSHYIELASNTYALTQL